MAAIKDEQGLPGAIVGVYALPDLLELVRTFNAMEQEVLTNDQCQMGFHDQGNSVLLGTEFTFCNDELRGMKVGKGHGQEAEAVKMLQAWAAQVHDAVQTVEAGKSDHAIKFTYAMRDGSSWWWKLDVDDGCLETQTQPATLPEFEGAVGKIVTQHIFGIGQTIAKLTPDTSPRGGGGHISLDAETLFGGSAELFLETLLCLQHNFEMWNDMMKDADTLNAPWLAEMGMKDKRADAITEFTALAQALIVEVHAGTCDLTSAVKQVKEFNTLVVNPVAEELRGQRQLELPTDDN